MKYEGREESENVDDRRGLSGAAVGGGIVGVVVLLLATLLGIDPRILQALGFSAGGGQQTQRTPPDPKQEPIRKFSAVVLKDTETVWSKLFREELGKSYPKPKLVLFTGWVQSACGRASSAVGPFYCPGDEQLYLDLDFFEELTGKLGAHGQFAMAYVIAHEVGHHIQNQVGPPGKSTPYIRIVNNLREQMSEVEHNKWQVRLELQADYLAGVWAHHANKELKTLEPGDIESALSAAQAVGDDILQKKFQGRVRPESFTHGTARQRQGWYMKGYKTGSLKGMHELFRDGVNLDNP